MPPNIGTLPWVLTVGMLLVVGVKFSEILSAFDRTQRDEVQVLLADPRFHVRKISPV